jgi:hypothetical protein
MPDPTNAEPLTLVSRVTLAMFRTGPLFQVPTETEAQARVAIREVAAWLRETDSKWNMGGDAAAIADLLNDIS